MKKDVLFGIGLGLCGGAAIMAATLYLTRKKKPEERIEIIEKVNLGTAVVGLLCTIVNNVSESKVSKVRTQSVNETSKIDFSEDILSSMDDTIRDSLSKTPKGLDLDQIEVLEEIVEALDTDIEDISSCISDTEEIISSLEDAISNREALRDFIEESLESNQTSETLLRDIKSYSEVSKNKTIVEKLFALTKEISV